MAEIKIEKKKPIWPWVLITIIILAAIAYFIYANNETDDYPDDINSDDVDDMNMDSDTSNDTITYDEAMDISDTTSTKIV